MKQKIISILIMSFLLFIAIEILTESKEILDTVAYSFSIWKNNLFPSLFPFFVLSEILINYGFIELVGELFKPIMNRLFKVSGTSAFIFIMSLISGFPSNARYTRNLYEQGLINEAEATKILTFTHFSNPPIIITVLREPEKEFSDNPSHGALLLPARIYAFLLASCRL